MTVLKSIFDKAVSTPSLSPARRARAAGEFVALCDAMGSGFHGEINGWAIHVDRVNLIREGTLEDLGLCEEEHP